MSRSICKIGDVGPLVTRDWGFDFSAATWIVLASAETTDEPPVNVYHLRDVTAYQTLGAGDPSTGVAVLPLFSGKGLPSDAAAPVTTGAGDIVTVTVAAGPAGTITQHLYMSLATDPTGAKFRVASGPDGFMSGGLPVGDPNYSPGAGEDIVGLSAGTPAADAVLIEPLPPGDESLTLGETTPLGKTPTTSEIVSSPATGTLTVGDHQFVVVNSRAPDSDLPTTIRFEFVFRDPTVPLEITYPRFGFEELQFSDDVTP